ncbi:Zinc finger, FYVE/PHD-type [Corchorus olitorius]|uniref:Zinc finger, FYVE/PHD-type n=1 Tax=Corchorus olitorius TaxID=93759 RepID=A0A1R3KLQ4_9ROSI|nr:Zinc finger, FYVE/PHD-type [Corchorus olitorius]
MPQNTHSDKVCDVCGGDSANYAELLIPCCKCSIQRHLYCMGGFVRGVQKDWDDWLCEDCVSGNYVSGKVNFDLRRQVAHRSQKAIGAGKVKFLPTEEVIKLTFGSPNKECSYKSSFISKPEPPKFTASPSKRTFMGSKTVGPSVNPIRVRANPSYLQFGSVKPARVGGMHINSSISQLGAKTPKESKEEKAPQQRAKESSRNVKLVSSIMSAIEVKTANSNATALNITKETLSAPPNSMPSLPFITAGNKAESVLVSYEENVRKKQKFDDILPDKEQKILHPKAEDTLRSSRQSPSRENTAFLGQNFDASEPKNSNVAEREIWNDQLKVSLYCEHFPALKNIWKGGFKFLDSATPGELYGGFLAKPPCIVHRKAYDFLTNMPPVIQVNLLHECHVQADFLQNGGLDLRDIAFYIFPKDDTDRSRQNYCQLFQLMDIKNSVMQSEMNGVELLIFTFKWLHVDSQDLFPRSKADFFCGVFRRKKDNQTKLHQKLPSIVPHLEYKHDDNASSEADMDIDMIGGQAVGTLDMAVSKESTMDLNEWAGKEICDAKARGVSSSQPEEIIEDSSLQGSKKQSQALAYDVSDDPSAACPPPPGFSGKGTKVGPVIKTEGTYNEKPFKLTEKNGLHYSPVSRKDNSHIIAPSVCGLCPVEVKAEVQEVVYNPSAACRSPLVDKGTQIGLEVQGHDDEKAIAAGEKKGLQGSSIPSEDKSKRVSGSFNAPCAGVFKAKVNVENDIVKTRVKLSFAGRSRGRIPGATTGGGLIRDESGKWIIGYNLKIGVCSSLTTDLWALYEGLKLSWDKGCRKVVVESDSVAVVECLKKPLCLLDSNRALIQSCRDLLNNNWDCKLQIVRRDENSCADWLAANVEVNQQGLSIIKVPPFKLIPLLERDRTRKTTNSSS